MASLQGTAIARRMRGGEAPAPGTALPPRPACLRKPGSALQGVLTSARRLSLSPKAQPYFLPREDSREAVIHREDDPDGLGGGGLPRPHRVTVIKWTCSWATGALPAANLGQLSQFVFV